MTRLDNNMPQKTEKTRKIRKNTDCFVKKGIDGGKWP
jgi:hypothetical protein